KSTRPTNSSSDEPLLVTLGDNLTITSTTPSKLAQQYLKDFSSSKKDEGELFINEDPDTASVKLPDVVEGSDSEVSSFNSNIWVNYSNGNQALNKQVESDQYSVATLVIDGTNYLVQVVNEHDQSTCPPDQETIVTALSAPGFQSEDLATSSLSVSKERDIGIHLGENLILHAEQPETLSAGDIIALELSAPASSCSEIVSDLSHLLCTPKLTKTPISTAQNNLVTPSIPSYTITSNQLNTNDAPNIQTDSGNTKILNNQVIKSKAIRSSTPKKITVKLPISSLNRQRNKLQI
uniref:Uncharacterized protein n=1 Tax=Ciona savignyi TaxID=51511 RepID=H2YE58_CIOSA